MNSKLLVQCISVKKSNALFRDYLRLRPDQAQAYQELKERLAQQYPDDTVRYTTGKDQFTVQIMQKAKES
jgi:GrpB-like predicted nucleotidyltransferase (UPF0157 family)